MIGIISKLKTWLTACSLAVSGAFLLWLHGRRAGVAAAKADAQRANVEALRKARDVEHEIQSMDAGTVHDELARKWVRDD